MGKKEKPPTTPAPAQLSVEERQRIWEWVKAEYPMFANREMLRQMWQRCRTWYARDNREFANWAAVFEGWIVMQYERLDGAQPNASSHLRGASLSKHVEKVGRKNRDDAEGLAGAIGQLFLVEGGRR